MPDALVEVIGRVTDVGNRLRRDAIVGDILQFRSEHQHARGGERARESYETRFIDPMMMNAVDDDHPRRMLDADGIVEARPKQACSRWNLDDSFSDIMCAKANE